MKRSAIAGKQRWLYSSTRILFIFVASISFYFGKDICVIGFRSPLRSVDATVQKVSPDADNIKEQVLSPALQVSIS